MFEKSFAKLLTNHRRKSRLLSRLAKRSALRLEILEDRKLLTANIATGYSTFQFAEDLASDFGGRVVDINNDGALDVVGNSVHIRSGNGWQTYANGPGVGKLVDLDGDNDLDVLRGRYWVENVGGGQGWAQHEFATVASGVVYVSSDVADFDSDGDMDIVLTRGNKVDWFENVNGNASAWTEHEITGPTIFDFLDTVTADMNNDGEMDIVLSPITFHILWLEGRGDGSFEPYYREVGITADDGRVYTSAWSLNVGDFDEDGRTDLFAVDGTNGETAIRWFTPKDDPTSRFRRTIVDRVRTADSETLSVDIDDDGEQELIVTNRSNDSLLVYERTSDFGFTQVQLGNDYIGPIIDSGDLDGDGDLDLVGNDFIFWNTGGDFHIETTDIAPTAIASNGEASVLRIEATHNGQGADDDIVLTSFSFMVDDGTGEVGSSPLDASRMASLFESWRIYLGDGIGGAGDLLSSAPPLIEDGVVHVDLSSVALNHRGLHPGETRSYYLEVKMAATAHEFGNYRITNLTDLGILTGSDATATNPTGSVVANKDYSPNVSATLESAGNISFEMNTVMLNEGTYEPSAVVEVLRIDATHTGLVDGEVARLAFRIDEPASGGPLDSQTVNGLIENLRIVAEDNSEVVRMDNLSLNNGVLLVDLPDGDSRLNLFNETRSFRVVIEIGSNATNQAIRGFRVTHLTSDSNSERSTVELASNDATATLVSTPDQSATIFTGTEVDVVVTSSMTTPVTGQQITYTVTVSNQHATTGASGIELQGLLPNGLLNIVLVDLQTSGGATSSHSIGDSLFGTWTDTLTLPRLSSVTYTMTGTVSELGSANRSMEPEFLLSQVSTTISNSLFDTNPDNNQDARADLVRLSSTGTGQFVDSGINMANLDGNGAVRFNDLALGDIDGDGDVDAIVTRGASGSPNHATVLFNDGTGNYTEGNQDFGYSNFTGAVLGDFDGDGDLDLYLATSTGISGVTDDTDRVYLNDGNGVFTQTIQSLPYLTESVEVGDMDGDGDLDIVISGSNQSHTLRHHIAGIFAPRDSFGVLNNLEEMKLADVDGDGDLDVIGKKNVNSFSDDLRVYLNNGNYQYSVGAQIASYTVMDFEVGDVDNDGDVDILVARESIAIGSGPNSLDRELWLIQRAVNNGNGTFATSYTGTWGSYLALELGDFDNDGDLDAFVVEEVYAGDDGSGTVYDEDAVAPESVSGRVWANNGSGGFSEGPQALDYGVVPTSPFSSADFSVTAADINGDGSLDIVTGDFTAAKVWFNNVAPTLTVTNSNLAVEQNTIAGNSGLVSDSAYESLSLAASIGTVTNNGDGTWSWSLTETSSLATITVTVTATDSSGSIAEVSFELEVGLAPVIAANNASVSVDEGQTAINSGSFSDPDSALAANLTASVGTVHDNGDGTWSWSFDTSDGPDQSQTVTIAATDAQGLTSTAVFALVVNNLAPVITADETTVTVNEGATAFMTGTISDAGQDEVTLSASIGTVTDNGDGTWNWQFETNDGPDDSRTVTITATDSDGASSQVSFELIVNNIGPALNFDTSTLYLFEGQVASKTGTVSDVDGVASLTASQGTVVLNADETWTWTDIASTSFEAPPQRVILTATDQDGAIRTREFTLTVFDVPVLFNFDASDVSVNEGETVSRTGTYDNPHNEPLFFTSTVGTFTDFGDGNFVWIWDAADGPNIQGVSYGFSDDDGSVGGFFEVTVNNVAPAVAVNNASVAVPEGSTTSNSGTVSDPGLDTVSLSASVGTVTNSGNGTWSWSFNTNDGPDQSQTVTITASDSDGAETSTSFALIVNNVAPTVSAANATVTVDEGQLATNTGSFGDVGLDTVGLTASVGTVTSNGNGTWSWSFLTSEGFEDSQSVTITVTDSDGASNSVSFELTVFDLPVAVSVPENSQAVANLTTVVPTATDFRIFGEAPAGELGPGQTLSADQFITSPNGMARLIMQNDGNLVVYLNGQATWASGTNNGANTNTTTIEADGEMVIRNGSGDIIYISDSGGNSGAYARLRVDDSGVPQIVRVDGELLWEGFLNVFFGQGRHSAPGPMRPEFTLGADTHLFEILSGDELQFIVPPDFEFPTDADSDGVYEVSVLADDGIGNVIPKTLLVTVLDVAESPATIVGSFVNHIDYTGDGTSIDTGKSLARETDSPTQLTYDNLINSSGGIRGLVFEIQGLAGSVTTSDFVFQMSPTGAFDEATNPVANWEAAPAPESITATPGSPNRILINWPDDVIANRWLRVTVLASDNTGLSESEVYYVGHLLGETTGASNSVFTVSFADITPIRAAVGDTVIASSTLDIDKNGTVAFADISAMRENVGTQLTIITIPASASSGGQMLQSAGSEDNHTKNGDLKTSAVDLSLQQLISTPEVHRSDFSNRRTDLVDFAWHELGIPTLSRPEAASTNQSGGRVNTDAIDNFYSSMIDETEQTSLAESRDNDADSSLGSPLENRRLVVAKG